MRITRICEANVSFRRRGVGKERKKDSLRNFTPEMQPVTRMWQKTDKHRQKYKQTDGMEDDGNKKPYGKREREKKYFHNRKGKAAMQKQTKTDKKNSYKQTKWKPCKIKRKKHRYGEKKRNRKTGTLKNAKGGKQPRKNRQKFRQTNDVKKR